MYHVYKFICLYVYMFIYHVYKVICLYVYRSFLEEVKFHLEEPALPTRPSHPHVNSPLKLFFVVLINYER